MLPSAERASVVAPASSGRRILSRIASPFSAANPRAVAEFSVSIDDELRQFSPGDIVTGAVTVRIARPTRITHIVVCLHGYVQVFRHVGQPGERYRPSAARHQRSSEAPIGGAYTLFEVEQVLCGDGRLTEGKYMFEFELVFPKYSLPSSIDFERGTISYMVTTALTRPTTISPVLISERKLFYVERIDVSKIGKPLSRTITLEPVSRRPRPRTRRIDTGDKLGRKVDSARQSSDPTPPPSDTPDLGSPAMSELSFEDILNTVRGPRSECQSSINGSESGGVSTSGASTNNKIIQATIVPDTGSCLRGDSITVTVTVNHTKHIKSLYGVIVTLYRHARVDLQADKSQAVTEQGNRSGRHEDYYPRSLTGLSGLSLSGSGTIHVFRKDLSQDLVPLIIDPNTLRAEVTAKVRVPDDAFPTISNVPGAMISFRYYVEAIVDIQGKLGGSERVVAPLQLGVPEHVMLADASERNRIGGQPTNITVVDTAALRRDKGVISSTFEIVVGTHDTARRKGKQRLDVADISSTPLEAEAQAYATADPQPYTEMNDASHGHMYPEAYWHGPGYDPRWYEWYMHPENHAAAAAYHHYSYWHHYYGQHGPPIAYGNGSAPQIPVPHLPDESQMSEKERMRIAETRLLPSQPPVEHEGIGPWDEASAPYLPDEDDPNRAPPTAIPLAGSSTHASLIHQHYLLHGLPIVPRYEPRPTNANYAVMGSGEVDISRQEARTSPPPQPNSAASEPFEGFTANGPPLAPHEQVWPQVATHEPSAPTAQDLDTSDVGAVERHTPEPILA